MSNYGIEAQKTAITKWEKGDTTPSAYQIIAICFALGVPDMLSEFAGSLPSEDPDLNEKGLQKLFEYRQLLIASGLYKPKARESYVNFYGVLDAVHYTENYRGLICVPDFMPT